MARHTFATIIQEQHVLVESVSQLLGHRNIRTTQIYVKVSQKKVSKNMKALKVKLAVTNEDKKQSFQ